MTKIEQINHNSVTAAAFNGLGGGDQFFARFYVMSQYSISCLT